jgi:hypothetical protein
LGIMRSPAKTLAHQFLTSSPLTLLAFGILLSLFDFSALYGAASRDGVLRIDHGVGLLQNYGLISSIFGNSVFLYLAKIYYDAIRSIRKSKAVADSAPLEASLAGLDAMIAMEREYRFLAYLFLVIGSAFWVSNVSFHVIGNPELRWGHKVFDSPDHRLAFYASRLHNAYSWLIVLPLLGHVMIYASVQLRRIVGAAAERRLLRYDLLNPDQKGGFLFVERAHVAFNAVVALIYVQITMHIETFSQMHAEHVVAYVFVTVAFIGINRIFLGDIYATVKDLKLDALNRIKDSVYENDKLSFEILKYCYERRINEFSLVNFVIKAGAIALSGAIKVWPSIAKSLTGF